MDYNEQIGYRGVSKVIDDILRDLPLGNTIVVNMNFYQIEGHYYQSEYTYKDKENSCHKVPVQMRRFNDIGDLRRHIFNKITYDNIVLLNSIRIDKNGEYGISYYILNKKED